jgi:hypothetical protein
LGFGVFFRVGHLTTDDKIEPASLSFADQEMFLRKYFYGVSRTFVREAAGAFAGGKRRALRHAQSVLGL